MFPKKPQLSINIPSKTDLLKMIVGITKHVATLNHFSNSDSQKIALAVDEGVTNVMKHSYKCKKNENIKLEYFSNTHGLKIKIVFRGIPPVFDTKNVDINKLIKGKRKGGLGVKLIKNIMDSVNYKTIDDINYCEMIKWKKKK